MLVERRVSGKLERLVAEEEPVVALHGPRSVGKSTVLRLIAEGRGAPVVDLDDMEVREAVAGNLAAVTRGPAPLCIDEYQRLPDILDGIKARLNREGGRPGTAVITGSTRQVALPVTAQALTGRLHSVTIWPLSQGELAGAPEDLLERLSVRPEETAGAPDVYHLAEGVRGPGVRRRHAARGAPHWRRQGEWFDDFVRQSVERDALELSNIRQRQAMVDLLRHLTAQTGHLLNISKAAEAVGVGVSQDRRSPPPAVGGPVSRRPAARVGQDPPFPSQRPPQGARG